MPSNPPIHPPVALDDDAIAALLAPLLGGAAPREVARVDGGLTNTLLRVVAPDGAVWALRVRAAPADAFDAERRLLARLAGALPVPEVALAGARGGLAYVAYRWIDGVTLNECRRRVPAAELEALAEPLGALLARLAGALPADAAGALPRLAVAPALARADATLREGPARERLGAPLADALRARLAAGAPRLLALAGPAGLVHGDFGGRNVIVREASARETGGRWAVGGVLDWETAAIGPALWDVGSLFRYSHRYAPAFRAGFARGHRAAGGALPPDWWEAARLLDATRLVGILADARELPTVFPECRALVASLIADDAPVAA